MPSSLESLSLDGLALNDATTFDLESFEFNPAQKRQRWISGEDADGDVLAEPSRAGNRPAIVTLRVVPQADMDTALSKIGQIVDKLYEAEQQPDGLALAWTPADSTKSATAYVLSGEITDLPVSLDAGWFAKSPTITLRLDCLPYMEGPEVTSAATLTDSNPAQILTVASVTGDVPAKARLVVTDAATQSRRHVEWGLQWRYYDAATSLLIDSDSLTALGGTGTTRTGAYDPGAAGNSVIRGTLTSTPLAVCSTGNQSHVGQFRVKARVYAAPTSDSTADEFKVRLNWKEGDGPLRANPYTSPALVNGWSEVDLGVINVPPKLLGTQRWTGQVEAYSADGGDTLDVDVVYLIPCGEGYGKARAPLTLETVTAFSARDEFDQSAGALAGKTAAVGGAWAGAGDADDFTVETTGHTAQRTATSDADEATGRYAVSGVAAYAAQIVQVDLKANATGAIQGVLGRYASTSNYVMIVVRPSARELLFLKKVAGTETSLASDVIVPWTANAYYTIRLLIDASGAWAVWYGPRNGVSSAPIVSGYDSALATGGALASGKPGFYDANASASAITRNYDNFIAGVPTADAVVFSGQSAEIRHDSAIRKDSTGTYWGPISNYRGARLFIPPAGDESRTSRFFVKARRSDIDVAADDQIADSTTVTVHYTPRYSTAPR